MPPIDATGGVVSCGGGALAVFTWKVACVTGTAWPPWSKTRSCSIVTVYVPSSDASHDPPDA